MRGKRLDIQGLRAIAVVLVIANHLVGWPAGGFIGVDVFFVISGFLITGLLIRENERHGKISLRQFYVRRVKRILPAALSVSVVTIAFAFIVFSPIRAVSILVDGIWASVFMANWHFIAIGTDYMHAADATSPLQHYWSLSVEEQFYLVWPVLLLAVLAIGARYPRRAIGFALTVIAVASFTWAVWETSNNPTWAYFSTFSRVWELALGAILACASPFMERLPPRLRPALSWVGLFVLAGSALAITSTTPFPAPWALIPVLATVLVIAAGTGGPVRFLNPITNRVVVYLGTISYSLYLWHLPVITFVDTYLPQRGTKYLLLSVAIILVLSVLSYHWIEDPLRHARWTRRRSIATAISTGPAAPKVASSRLRRIALPALSMVLVLLMGATYLNRLPLTTAAAESGPPVSLEGLAPTSALTSNEAEREEAILAALDDTDWPDLSPTIAELGRDSRASEWTTDGCLGLEASRSKTPEEHALTCVYGNPDAANTIAILGDSQAISYVPALRAAIDDDWKIHVFTMSQCPWADVSVLLADGAPDPMCDEFRDWSIDQIQSLSPQRVVLTAAPTSIKRLASDPDDELANQEYEAGLRKTLSDVSDFDTVVLDAPPDMTSLVECSVRGTVPADCVREPKGVFVRIGLMVRKIASEFPNVSAPSTINWFCSRDAECPGYINNVPTLADGAHLSEAAAKTLGPLMSDALRLDSAS